MWAKFQLVKMFPVSKRQALLGLLFSFLTNQIVPSEQLEILPKVENDEQVIEQGSTLTLSCIIDLLDSVTEPRWTLPQFQASLSATLLRHGRLNKTTFKNETHLISTMTLTNTTSDDTGFYNCSGNWEKEHRYVYVSSNENLSLMRNQNYIFPRFNLTASTRDSILIPDITTHPNVTISIFRQTREIGVEPQKAFRKIFDSSTPTGNSRWSFHPRNGLTLKNPTVSDSSIYYVVSYLRFANGKRVNIKHDKKSKEFLSWVIPPDKLDYSAVMTFSLIVEGMEIEKLGAPDDPVEGSNVTLICTTSAYFHNSPPTWFYYDSGRYNQVTFNEGIQIKTEREWRDLIFYKSQLHLSNVTLNSPYQKLKCGNDIENSTVKEISFAVKEINNEPVNSSINLEKGIAQILPCNRLSQHVPIHWLKDGNQYSGKVDETETSSVLPLRGTAKEVGIYECKWKNSRGENRYRNFNVSVTFVEEETNDTILSITLIGLLIGSAIGVGIEIKLYFNKLHKKKIDKRTETKLDKILKSEDPSEIKLCSD